MSYMTYTTVREPVFAAADKSRINCRVHFLDIGREVPFTADKDDTEEHGREIYRRCAAEEFGKVAAFVAPPEPVPAVVTMRQARLALLGAGLLERVNTAVSGMTGAEGEKARIEWQFASTIERQSGLVKSLGTSLSLTGAKIDELFRQAALL